MFKNKINLIRNCNSIISDEIMFKIKKVHTLVRRAHYTVACNDLEEIIKKISILKNENDYFLKYFSF
jgi:hypothetical protein